MSQRNECEESIFVSTLFLWIAAVLLMVLFCSCSATDKMASAEKKEGAAIVKSDQAKSAVLGRIADYNREEAYALTLPQSPQASDVEKELVSLQFNLTGSAATPSATLDKFVDNLVKDDLQSHANYAALVTKSETSDNNLKAKVVTTTEERDQARTVANTLAMTQATALDKVNGWIDDLWILGTILVALIAFLALIKFGIITGTTATAIAKDIP